MRKRNLKWNQSHIEMGKWGKRMLFSFGQIWKWISPRTTTIWGFQCRTMEIRMKRKEQRERKELKEPKEGFWGRMAHVLGKSGINIHLAIIKAKPHTKYSNEQHFYLNRGQGSSLRSGPSWKFGICQKFGWMKPGSCCLLPAAWLLVPGCLGAWLTFLRLDCARLIKNWMMKAPETMTLTLKLLNLPPPQVGKCRVLPRKTIISYSYATLGTRKEKAETEIKIEQIRLVRTALIICSYIHYL